MQRKLPFLGILVFAFFLSCCTKESTPTSTSISIKENTPINPIADLISHKYTVETLAFSPDGKTIASGSESTVWLWDLFGKELIRSFKGHTGDVRSIAFSPNGKFIASASMDGTIKIWNVSNGSLMRTIMADKAGVITVAISPDSKYISTSTTNNNIGIWEVESGTQNRILTGHKDEVNSVAYSYDNKWLASGASDTVIIWSLSDGSVQKRLSGHKFTIYSLAFSPDNKLLASASMDSTANIWATSGSETPIHTLTGHSESEIAYGVAFSPDGRFLATAGTDAKVILWEVKTGKIFQSLTVGDVLVPGVAFSPDGKTLAATGHKGVYLWDIPQEYIGSTPTKAPIEIPTIQSTLTPTSESQTPQGPEGIVVNGGNLRKEPNISPLTVIGQLCPGDEFVILEQTTRSTSIWYRVYVSKIKQNCDPNRVQISTQGWFNSNLTRLK